MNTWPASLRDLARRLAARIIKPKITRHTVRIYLKVKIKSLAEESRIIRQEEQKLIGRTKRAPKYVESKGVAARLEAGLGASGRKIKVGGLIREAKARQAKAPVIEHYESMYYGLHRHRTEEVRREARSAHLAYGFLRRTPYLRIEKANSKSPNLDAVSRMVAKYGHQKLSQVEIDVKAWYEAAPGDSQQTA